jgi:hypothetical protein
MRDLGGNSHRPFGAIERRGTPSVLCRNRSTGQNPCPEAANGREQALQNQRQHGRTSCLVTNFQSGLGSGCKR